MTNTVTRLGTIFVLLGAVTLFAPLVGFELLAADRGFQVEFADDERSAPLGIQTTYTGDTIEYERSWSWEQFSYTTTNTSAAVARLENNLDNPLDIEIEVASVRWANGNDRRILDPVQGTKALGSGEMSTVELVCSQEVAGEADNAIVGLDVKADGSPVTVYSRDYTITGVSFACEGEQSAGSGDPDEIVPIEETSFTLLNDTIEAGSSSGGFSQDGSRVTFDVRNDGPDEITVTGIGVRDTTSDANEVYHCADFTLFPPSCTATDNEVIVDGTTTGYKSVDEAITIGPGNTYSLDQNATIASNDTATITFEQFREGGFNSQVDMSETDLTVVLVVEDPDAPGEEYGIETSISIPP